MTDATLPQLPEPDQISYVTDSVMRKYEVRSFTDGQMHAYAQTAVAPLLVRIEVLEKALSDLYVKCPTSLECKDFHHSKGERHAVDGPCGPADDFIAALSAASAALQQQQVKGK